MLEREREEKEQEKRPVCYIFIYPFFSLLFIKVSTIGGKKQSSVFVLKKKILPYHLILHCSGLTRYISKPQHFLGMNLIKQTIEEEYLLDSLNQMPSLQLPK